MESGATLCLKLQSTPVTIISRNCAQLAKDSLFQMSICPVINSFTSLNILSFGEEVLPGHEFIIITFDMV